MASVCPCAVNMKFAEAAKVSERKASKCSFTIESILGLKRSEEAARFINPHRPWADLLNVTGSSYSDSSPRSYDPSITVKEGKGSDREMCCIESDGRSDDRFSYGPNCCWFRGRRARTAFSRNQIEVLEEEFQLNCYPGIDVREELAQKLALDEDRIQIWFQNRRAKLKRSRRESQFLMVKNALINSGVQKQKTGSQL